MNLKQFESSFFLSKKKSYVVRADVVTDLGTDGRTRRDCRYSQPVKKVFGNRDAQHLKFAQALQIFIINSNCQRRH